MALRYRGGPFTFLGRLRDQLVAAVREHDGTACRLLAATAALDKLGDRAHRAEQAAAAATRQKDYRSGKSR